MLFEIGKSEIDRNFQGNGERLDEFVRKLKEADADPAIRPSYIHIVGYASPDGGYRFNQRLARQRAENLASYLRRRNNIPDSMITIESAGIDWQGLDRAVGESTLRNKVRVQNIIRQEPEFTYDSRGVLIRSRKQQLQNLDGGRTWNWMMDNLYPSLRSSASVVCYIEKVEDHSESSEISELSEPSEQSQPAEPSEAIEVVEAEEIAPTAVITSEEALTILQEAIAAVKEGVAEPSDAVAIPEDEYVRYPMFALRSNLLVPLLNVGIEVPVAKHWSVGADYYYPWIWPASDNKNCFELIFVSAEARYWFNPVKGAEVEGKNYLTGHSVAAYGAWGYYDVEHNWNGHQGHAWSAGVDYMYALPVAKGKLRFEFEIAVGAIWSPEAQPYRVYESGGDLVRDPSLRKNFRYFGPTKASVSIVLPINRKVKRVNPVEP